MAEYPVKISKREINLFKILDVIGMTFVAIGTLNNFLDGVDHEPFTKSIFYPYTNFLVPATNIATLAATIFFLFFPTQLWIIFLFFMIESANLLLTGFENVGIAVYINFFAFLCASGYARRHFKLKAIAIGLYLLVLLLTGIPSKGFLFFLYNIGFSAFLAGSYIILYFMLQDKLKFLFTDVDVPGCEPAVKLPQKGSVLDLKAIGLTDRQISCIGYTLNTSYNYKKIAEELITSESTVKKDMQDLFKIFGVKNREMLRLLLVQYTII